MRSLLILATFIAGPAIGHVTISPQQSTVGAREKYVVRLPDEKEAETVALELHFPLGLKFSALEQKVGWKAEILRDSSGAIRGVRWTGKLEPMEFAEFGLLATNPASEGEIVWNATQVFADGTRVSNGAAPSGPKARRRAFAWSGEETGDGVPSALAI
ncbi:MAG TPA: DUF1775 domain-containing protein [Sphingomicrobium sp.]|nr:DUF1775 domain-containing protein [Sphingomicrobium sp.]